MIFAAGLGTRLQTVTQTMPKALVQIDGLPLLEHCLRNLQSQGVTQVVINVHHFADQIEAYVHKRKSTGLEILISDERALLLETGGGVRKAADLLLHGFARSHPQAPILLHNVDIFSNLNLAALMQFHLHSSADATLAASVRDSKRYLYFDTAGRLQGWQNQITGEQKPTAFDASKLQAMAFSGIHILSANMLSELQAWPERFSIIDFYLSNLKDHTYQLYAQAGMRVLDVGKPESIALAAQFIHNHPPLS